MCGGFFFLISFLICLDIHYIIKVAQIKVILLPCGCSLKYHVSSGLIYRIAYDKQFVKLHPEYCT